MDTGIRKQVFGNFTEALDYRMIPKRILNNLLQIFSQNFPEFSKTIEQIILQCLEGFTIHPKAERGIIFVIALICQIQQNQQGEYEKNLVELCKMIYNIAAEGAMCQNANVRQGCAWLLDRLLGLGLQEDDRLNSHMLKSARQLAKVLSLDRKTQIRNIGIKIAGKLVLGQRLTFAAQFDPIAQLRKQAVNSLQVDPSNQKLLIDKLKDRDEKVRVAAVCMLKQLGFTSLYQKGRRLIVRMAISDRSKAVRAVCKEFVQINFEFKSYMSLVEFLDAIRLDTLPRSQEKELMKCMKFIIEDVFTVDQAKDVLFNEVLPSFNSMSTLSKTQALIIRFLSDYMSIKSQDQLFEALPNLSTLKAIISKYVDQKDLFIVEQVIRTAFNCDIGEEGIRSDLLSLLTTLCISLPDFHDKIDKNYIQGKDHQLSFCQNIHDLLCLVVRQIKHLLKEYDSEFNRVMIECINQVREGLMESDDGSQQSLLQQKENILNQIDQIQGDLDVQNTEDNDAEIFRTWNQANLDNLNDELEKVTGDIDYKFTRCLILLSETLKISAQNQLNAEIQDVFPSLIQPALFYQNDDIQLLAVICLGDLCLLKYDLCKQYFQMFDKIIQNYTDSCMFVIAVQYFFDFLHVFDIQKDPHFASMYCKTLSKIEEMLEWPSDELVGQIVEGFCKLLILGRLQQCEIILAKLMVLYFGANSEKVKQCLNLFFEKYSIVSEQNSINLQLASRLILFGIKLTLDDEKVEIMKNVQQNQTKRIIAYILNFLSPENLTKYGKFEATKNQHFELFYFICQDTLDSQPRPKTLLTYLKILQNIEIKSFNRFQIFIAYTQVIKLLEKHAKNGQVIHILHCILDVIKQMPNLTYRKQDQNLDIQLQQEYENSVRNCRTFCQVQQKQSVILTTEDPDDPIEYSDDNEVPSKRPRDEEYQFESYKLARFE